MSSAKQSTDLTLQYGVCLALSHCRNALYLLYEDDNQNPLTCLSIGTLMTSVIARFHDCAGLVICHWSDHHLDKRLVKWTAICRSFLHGSDSFLVRVLQCRGAVDSFRPCSDVWQFDSWVRGVWPRELGGHQASPPRLIEKCVHQSYPT
jgi:hypothetical protein